MKIQVQLCLRILRRYFLRSSAKTQKATANTLRRNKTSQMSIFLILPIKRLAFASDIWRGEVLRQFFRHIFKQKCLFLWSQNVVPVKRSAVTGHTVKLSVISDRCYSGSQLRIRAEAVRIITTSSKQASFSVRASSHIQQPFWPVLSVVSACACSSPRYIHFIGPLRNHGACTSVFAIATSIPPHYLCKEQQRNRKGRSCKMKITRAKKWRLKGNSSLQWPLTSNFYCKLQTSFWQLTQNRLLRQNLS